MTNPELEADIQTKANTIAPVLQDWLVTEARTSTRDVNAYLMELKRFDEDLKLTYDDSRNLTAGKSKGHLERPTGVWWQGFVTNPSDDFLSAKQTFASQMLLSGARRNQIMLEARNQKEYGNRWLSDEIGIDLTGVVADRIAERFDVKKVKSIDFEDTTLALDGINGLLWTAEWSVNRARYAFEQLYQYGRYDIVNPDSMCAKLQRGMQEVWAGLATDHIIYAASLRGGDLSRVPFLQPISITKQPEDPVYYPFAGETPKV